MGAPKPSDPFHLPSTPGHIKDCIVIATGVNGMPVTTNVAGVDNAYDAPSGVTAFFDTMVTPDPANGPGNPANDGMNT